MSLVPTSKRTICILGPSPGSSGGIGMMMGYLRQTESKKYSLNFVCSGGSPGPWRKRVMSFMRALFGLLRSSGETDFFHLNTSSGGSTYRKLIFSYAIRFLRGKYVIHLHSGAYPEFFANSSFVLRMAIRSMFLNASGVIVLGTYWSSWVHAHLSVPPERIFMLPNAVPQGEMVEATRRDRNKPVTFLFVGRVEPAKGIYELLEAWRIADRDPDSRLLIVGSLSKRHSDIATQISEMRDSGVVHLGWLSSAQLKDFYRIADAIVLPSHFENLPLVLLEGMSWGLVPVATPVGAIPDLVIDGVNGLLVPSKDSRSLALALSSLSSDMDLLDRLSIESFAMWRKHYNLDVYRSAFDGIYNRIAHSG